MHCVLHAWLSHMHYLNARLSPLSSTVYYCIREYIGNDDGATWGGSVPAIVTAMSAPSRCLVRVQHQIWTSEHYIADAMSDKQDGVLDAWFVARRILLVRRSDFGEHVDEITLAPAMYLMLDNNHAVFSETVPSGIITMALQIYRKD